MHSQYFQSQNVGAALKEPHVAADVAVEAVEDSPCSVKCSSWEPTDKKLENIWFGNDSNDDTNNDDFRRHSRERRKSLS